MMMTRLLVAAAALGLVAAAPPRTVERVRPRDAAVATDPLPSWNDGEAKAAILAFIEEATAQTGPGFVPPSERIAVFDNDGTLWPERPLIEGQFALARLKVLAEADPSLRERQPFKAALEGDLAYLKEAGLPAINELLAATHSGMSTDEFEDLAREFFRTAKHPSLGRPYTELAYVPMVELLRLLRDNGFETWVVSGGTQDFVRVIAEEMYGVPPQRVIGTTPKLEFVERDGEWVVWRAPELGSFNDKAEKPANIALHIGRRPALAAGNVRSGGDVAMLTYCDGRRGPSLQLMINHDDPEREFAYAEADNASLNAAAQCGWTVVSVRDDWKTVFAPAERRGGEPGRSPR